ncbi:MAG: L-histidine N(Alpha)-methyltransferase [Myxococcales bacterium]|nr:L-histidine N(Alpha)-methyltransferase [Myxococcales bacterium]
MRRPAASASALSEDERLTLVEADRRLRDDFASDVRAGLTAVNKTLPCRYLYDAAGSHLFEAICDLPEYYLTRAELSILAERADEIAATAVDGAALVELGSGSATKTRILIDAMLRRSKPLRYVPIDISRSMLEESSRALLADYDDLEITAVAAEYRAGLRLLRREREMRKLILWLGSNVGNFGRRDAAKFLAGVRATMAPGDRLLVGIDLRKSREVLEAAYDDAAGVTGRFNLNLLQRINRELGGDFDLGAFRHRARWNERLGRVEMRIVSQARQRVTVAQLDLDVVFEAGEGIYTESSYKYSPDEIDRLARAAGLVIEERWLDAKERYSLNRMAPQSA